MKLTLFHTIPSRHFFSLVCVLFTGFILSIHPQSFLDSLISFFGISFILTYLISKKEKDYFEPLYIFSIYYLFVYVSALSIAIGGFENNTFLSNSRFYEDLDLVYTKSLLVAFLSYVSVFVGYKLFSKQQYNISLKTIVGVKSQLFFIAALTLYLLGFLNFIYNVFVFYSGDFISYYRNISIRYIDFGQYGTTLGYHFIYAGAYMVFIRMLEKNDHSFLIYTLVVISILIMASSGRITNTIFYLSSFLMIYYYNKGFTQLNKKYFFVGVSIAFLGILFYSLRYASSLYYNDMHNFSDGIAGFVYNFFQTDNLTYFLVDKGNIPNFAILMKVVDSWGRDIGYMFGSTLFYPFYGFISNDFFGLVGMPADITKSTWYSHISGGSLPVTGMGEMLLNFSIFGFPFGMFFFGAMGAFFRNLLFIYKSNIYLIFYSKFVFFFMLYPKGEFNNFNLFWFAVPSLIFLFSIYLVRSLNSAYKPNPC